MSCNQVKSKLVICILHIPPQKSENDFEREEHLRGFTTCSFNTTHLTKAYHSLTKDVFLRYFHCNIILWTPPVRSGAGAQQSLHSVSAKVLAVIGLSTDLYIYILFKSANAVEVPRYTGTTTYV